MDGERPGRSVEAALETSEIVWLSSVRPDGCPHVVPIWFVWDGAAIIVLSKPAAQKVRNLTIQPRAMVAIGEPAASFDVELIEAVAELADAPFDPTLLERFARKYAAQLLGAAITIDQFAATYSRVIRLRPTRWLGWGGPGWQPAG
jgi:PPOX class probable F420-dependent enzyme